MKASATMRAAGMSRRLTEARDVTIDPGTFLQPLDVDLRLDARSALPSRSIPGYERLGTAAAAARLAEVAALGLRGVVVRLLDDTVPHLGAWARRRETWVGTVAGLATAARDRGLELVVDPFSIALDRAGQWGLSADGQPDGGATLDLLHDLAAVVHRSGGTGIVTLGRVAREVEVTRAVAQDGLRVYSFSTNSETSTAYAGSSTHPTTNQKIWPGNLRDMLLWTVIDIDAGTDVPVTKPVENFHVVVETRRLLDSADALSRFLDDPATTRLAEQDPDLVAAVRRVRADVPGFLGRAAQVELGAYTVSGTTKLLALLAHDEGVAAARARLEELWVNAVTAAGPRGTVLIDRGATAWFRGGVLA
jgi:hypothetical protein